MNYLQEVVEFNRWKEVNQLPATAIALWHELMAMNNKCGWKQEFTVPNGILQSYAGLSRKQLDHARMLLIDHGLITYKKAKKVNQAGKYSIVPFVSYRQREGQHEGKQEGHKKDNERGTLVKLKYKLKLKLNIKDIASLLDTAETFFVMLSEKERERLLCFADDLGLDLVFEAMQRAKIEQKRCNYTLGILRDWSHKGIKSMADVERNDQDFQRFKQQKQAIPKQATGAYSQYF
ncbi:DnaD domain protein [Gracilibacillus salitolerans]|uniref:DnaD domain protein n=1 Tax=Gracilibacillus salitolerans TaxID=2663022 RepID=A0A5Q2TEI7_9BACI|nr:DnaD domain protein [Gracilibacillus salitolerans]QGH32587.1 DnaD domain protein [Gracilibacillus salitolerans]